MKLKRQLSLLCLFALVALFSSTANAANTAPAAAATPAPSVTTTPVQSPAPTGDLAILFTPASPAAGIPEWQPQLGCTLTFCNLCTQDGGVCRYTGGHCVCI